MSDAEKWEKRAWALIGGRWEDLHDRPSGCTDAALQLGREMADARAEEIADECARKVHRYVGPHGFGLAEAAGIARATITKPKECPTCGRSD